LLVGFVVTPQAPVEEAGEVVSVIILGDSDVDQQSSGEEEAEPKPEEIVAESVQPETTQQPTEVQPETPPVDPQPVAPTQEVTRVSPENVTAVEPEILTSQAPAESPWCSRWRPRCRPKSRRRFLRPRRRRPKK
jgi:protein TonB